MKEYFFNAEQYDKLFENQAFHECEMCNGVREVSFEHVRIVVNGKSMEFTAIPMLKCKICGDLAFTLFSLKKIHECFNELNARNATGVTCYPTEYRKRYDFCTDVNFLYDFRDYESIPGLMTEFSNIGFLQPVFFKKEALLYFVNSPEYETNIFSESYGTLSRIDKTDRSLAWDIPFGFNTNNLLIFWLGDLDKTDSDFRFILKPFNVESDHLLIDSDFYRAQLLGEWSNPIKEQQIILNKKTFMKNVKNKFGILLNHLDDECDYYSKKAVKPVVYTEKTLSETLNELHKVLVEGLNPSQLRLLYEQLYPKNARDKMYGKWGNIKLMEEIIDKLDTDPKKNIREIIAPLYLLNDFRIIFDHMLSKEELDKRKNNIVKSLGVTAFTDYEDIYNKEIIRLNNLFQYLVLITK